MKDRWKILISCLIVTFVLAVIIGCLSASFKRVELREYGILYHDLFKYSQDLTARSNGNYLVGIDRKFLGFPRGIISYEFNTVALTKDKSMIEISGLFSGRLIKDEVMNMYQLYGFEYQQVLKSSVGEFTRQALQYYSLSEIIGNRIEIDNNVRGYVCLKLELIYSWVQCDYVSLGKIGGNIPKPPILPVQTSFQQKLVLILQRHIQAQKKKNIFSSGGAELLQRISSLNSQVFFNITNSLVTAIGDNQNKQDALKQYINAPNFPVITTNYQFDI